MTLYTLLTVAPYAAVAALVLATAAAFRSAAR